jgi:ketosteroid isomerase-like protein
MTEWFATFLEPLKGEPEKVEIVAGDTLAFVNGCSLLRGQKKGEDSEREWRVRLTLCLEKRAGRWLVVADHTSVPFDMNTLEPLMKLSE